MATTRPQFMKIDEVAARLTVSRATIYNWIKDPEYAFPRQVRLGPNRVVWVRSEVEQWAKGRRDARADEALQAA
jgi:excisionase family DNA binding protein